MIHLIDQAIPSKCIRGYFQARLVSAHCHGRCREEEEQEVLVAELVVGPRWKKPRKTLFSVGAWDRDIVLLDEIMFLSCVWLFIGFLKCRYNKKYKNMLHSVCWIVFWNLCLYKIMRSGEYTHMFVSYCVSLLNCTSSMHVRWRIDVAPFCLVLFLLYLLVTPKDTQNWPYDKHKKELVIPQLWVWMNTMFRDVSWCFIVDEIK